MRLLLVIAFSLFRRKLILFYKLLLYDKLWKESKSLYIFNLHHAYARRHSWRINRDAKKGIVIVLITNVCIFCWKFRNKTEIVKKSLQVRFVHHFFGWKCPSHNDAFSRVFYLLRHSHQIFWSKHLNLSGQRTCVLYQFHKFSQDRVCIRSCWYSSSWILTENFVPYTNFLS